MCGSFDVDSRNKDIQSLISSLPPDSLQPRLGQLFPGQLALTIIADQDKTRPETMIWGFPGWAGKALVFNARAETAMRKKLFANALKHDRAAIPASGFYEWSSNEGKKSKDKYLFTDPENSVFYLAGFWSNFNNQQIEPHFTILTTEANQSVLPYHSRMPVLLRSEDLNDWLIGTDYINILNRVPFELDARQV